MATERPSAPTTKWAAQATRMPAAARRPPKRVPIGARYPDDRDDPRMLTTIHWDDCEAFEADLGAVGSRFTFLSDGAGARRLGVNRIQVPPGKAATPQHAENEELFFVLAGSGVSQQEDG